MLQDPVKGALKQSIDPLNSLNGVIAYATYMITDYLTGNRYITLNSLNGVIAYATRYTGEPALADRVDESLNSLNGVIAYATH